MISLSTFLGKVVNILFCTPPELVFGYNLFLFPKVIVKSDTEVGYFKNSDNEGSTKERKKIRKLQMTIFACKMTSYFTYIFGSLWAHRFFFFNQLFFFFFVEHLQRRDVHILV